MNTKPNWDELSHVEKSELEIKYLACGATELTLRQWWETNQPTADWQAEARAKAAKMENMELLRSAAKSIHSQAAELELEADLARQTARIELETQARIESERPAHGVPTGMALIEMGKQWLEGAPQARPGAPDLLGFTGAVGFVCNDCAGRILGRGCNLKALAHAPLWKPAIRPGCSLCEGGQS